MSDAQEMEVSRFSSGAWKEQPSMFAVVADRLMLNYL